MSRELEILKKGIRGLKLLQNEKQAEWEEKDDCSGLRDYYTGYMSALSTVEGMIAEMEQKNDQK